jgi:hypothetical protein
MELKSIVDRVRAEFSEMPGLQLTPAQTCRLLGLDRERCQAALDVLIASSFLRRTATGLIARVES